MKSIVVPLFSVSIWRRDDNNGSRSLELVVTSVLVWRRDDNNGNHLLQATVAFPPEPVAWHLGRDGSYSKKSSPLMPPG